MLVAKHEILCRGRKSFSAVSAKGISYFCFCCFVSLLPVVGRVFTGFSFRLMRKFFFIVNFAHKNSAQRKEKGNEKTKKQKVFMFAFLRNSSFFSSLARFGHWPMITFHL